MTTNICEKANAINSSSESAKKKIYLSAKAFGLAKERLLALPQEESEEYKGSREIILRENVSLDNYLEYRERDSNFPVHIYLHDGRIIAYELPTFPHGRVAATVIVLMGLWNYRDLAFGNGGTMILGINDARKPDSWI